MIDLERNKQAVRAYLDLAFNAKDPAEAAARHVGDKYIQHNPHAADGPEGFVAAISGFVGRFPDVSIDIRRMIAEGDMVVAHSLLKVSAEDRGSAAMDIFRLEDGRIVEHWDVVQAVPEHAANANTMF
ncbi:nuclear transport factor 2 family protein [Streptosporangium sp. NPDC000396]|uniref:nuclear transport factor 2 family protein n=1 Tax=Streptosporangium sp. NPDC000396 TaxID=3366185 RepID=UPI00369B7C80